MDQPYAMDPLDKQNSVPQMRRGYLSEDHDVLRQPNALDMKYPFPQSHLYPPNLSVRGGPIKWFGQYPGETQAGQDLHMTDPRYVPQDLILLVRDLDDKRLKGYYGYPLTNGMTAGVNTLGGLTGMNGLGMAATAGLNNGSANLNDVANAVGTSVGNANPSQPAYAPGQPTAAYAGSAAAVNSMNGLYAPGAPKQTKKKSKDLMAPIPPLHVQQQMVNKEDVAQKAETEDVISSKCSRCKKDFVQRLIFAKDSNSGKVNNEPKVFKLCHHCRDLQRQRSRRWQKKTKDKHGACRRCGNEIPLENQKFVLCPQCRQNLRVRKANRAAQGKCVHCSGPINVLIINDDNLDDSQDRRSSGSGSFKVCQRCRENDKIRRTNLERMGNCNRCAKSLSPAEQGKHKVCLSCRQKKKKLGSILSFSEPQSGPLPQHAAPVDGMTQNVYVPSMNYVSVDQPAMVLPPGTMNNPHGVPPQQEYQVGYGQIQPIIQAPDMYKQQMAHLPQMQPVADQSQNQYIGLPRGGGAYSRDRM